MRLEDPDYAPTAIKTLCRNCWDFNPEKRPQFNDIIDYIKHNFRIKTEIETDFSVQNHNKVSITYSKLYFHGSNLKSQFETIQKSINDKSSEKNSNSKNNDCYDIFVIPSSDNSFFDTSEDKQSSSYKRIDPARSRALMACQMDLELQRFLGDSENAKGMCLI